jgi:hypothetical protein
VPVRGNKEFVVIDLTSLVRDWLDGVAPNEGVALVANPGTGLLAVFDSKENLGTSHAPQHPAWYHNVEAHPEVEASTDGRPERYVAREAEATNASGSGSSRPSSIQATRSTRRGPIAASR